MRICISILLIFITISGCSVNKQQLVTKPYDEILISQNKNKPNLVNLGDGWLEITEEAIIENITPQQAKEKAIEKACKQGIEYYSGVEITSRISDTQVSTDNTILIDNFISLTKQTSQGIVLEKELIEEGIVSRGESLIKFVKVRVKIGKQKGKNDPYFTLTGSLNREHFKNNEQIELSLKSSKDCYLTVINICSNDSAYIIFPNEFRKNNFLKAGETFLLPNQKDKEMGLKFKVNLAIDKDKDAEMIKIIASKQKIDFSSDYSFSKYGTYKSTLKDLQHWLLKIPRDQIEEIDFQYFIGK